jgi:hypothetical protein
VLFALGSVIKQIVIIDAILLSCVHVIFARALPGGYRRAFRDVALMAAIGAAFWALLIGYFAATGRFEMFWVTNFSNARAYAGSPLFNVYRYFREARFLPGFLWFAIPVGALALLGALRDRRALLERQWALCLTAFVALQIKIALNGTAFLPHYYQYWLPMLAIAAGWAAGARSPIPREIPPWVMPAAGAVVASFLLVQQGRYLFFSADEWSRLKYGEGAIEGRDMSRAIRGILRPEEGFYQHGDHPELYYYSKRSPPSLVLWTEHLNDNWPASRILLTRHLAALEAAPPDLILVEDNDDPGTDASRRRDGRIARLLGGRQKVNEGRNARTVLEVMLPAYRPTPIEAFEDFPGFRSYVLKGSALDERLRNESVARLD